MFIWAFLASSIITLLPIWDGRFAIKSVVRQLFKGKDFPQATGAESLSEIDGVGSDNIDDRLEKNSVIAKEVQV